MSKVVAIRLISGEELVGVDVTPNHEKQVLNELHLKNPAQIIVTPPKGPNLPPNVGFAPFIPWFDFENDTPHFKREHVIVLAKPNKQLEAAYRQINNMIVTDTKPSLIVP